MKTLAEYIRANDMPGAENCLAEMLRAAPTPELWLRLAMVELSFPFYDEYSALDCCKKAVSLSDSLIDAWLLMASIQCNTTGSAEAGVLDKLSRLAVSPKDRARLLFLKACSIWPRDERAEKELLLQSVDTYPHLVWPYVHLGHPCKGTAEAGQYYRRALENVQHVFSDTDDSDYDPTDYRLHLYELVDGNFISSVNYQALIEDYQKAAQAG